MDAGTFSALAVSGVALISAGLTFRNNRAGQVATNRIEDRRVGRDEFDSITRELRESLDDVKEDLAHEKRLRQAEAEANATWKRAATGYIHNLRDDLRAAKVAVRQPPEGLELS